MKNSRGQRWKIIAFLIIIFNAIQINGASEHSVACFSDSHRVEPPTCVTLVIYVDDDYNETTPGWNTTHFDSIQKGINHAEDGCVVFVYNGTYREIIDVNKSIRLIGENRDSTLVYAIYDKNYIFKVSAEASFLCGFSIVGNGKEDNRGTFYGVLYTYFGSNSTLSMNNISNCKYGVYINGFEDENNEQYKFVRNVVISYNYVKNCKVGVYLERTNDNSIINNHFEEISESQSPEIAAITLKDTITSHIIGNYISKCSNGIYITGKKSRWNIIAENRIETEEIQNYCIVLDHAGFRNIINSNDFLKGRSYRVENTLFTLWLGNYYNDAMRNLENVKSEYLKLIFEVWYFGDIFPIGMLNIDVRARRTPH